MLLLLFVCLGVGLIAACLPSSDRPVQQEQQDVPDCDLEDFVNRETDCGFQSTKPAAKKTPAKPAPRTTRR